MPADYVNKLARMFQDIKVSEDLNQSFKEMHKHNKLALPGEKMLSDKICTFEQLEPVNIWHFYKSLDSDLLTKLDRTFMLELDSCYDNSVCPFA